jgi:hypothetical protein
MTLLVDSNGVVRTIETEQTVRYRSGKREISSTVRIDTLGATTVERPDWYGTAVTTTGNRTAEG